MWSISDHVWSIYDHIWSLYDHIWTTYDHIWTIYHYIWSMYDHIWTSYDHIYICIYIYIQIDKRREISHEPLDSQGQSEVQRRPHALEAAPPTGQWSAAKVRNSVVAATVAAT